MQRRALAAHAALAMHSMDGLGNCILHPLASSCCPLPHAVKLTNVVAKWVEEGQFVAAATFQELLLQSSTGDWGKGLQVGC